MLTTTYVLTMRLPSGLGLTELLNILATMLKGPICWENGDVIESVVIHPGVQLDKDVVVAVVNTTANPKYIPHIIQSAFPLSMKEMTEVVEIPEEKKVVKVRVRKRPHLNQKKESFSSSSSQQ